MLGIVLVQNVNVRTLFDSGATHSFISPYFATMLAKDKEFMENPLVIATPLGDSVDVQYVYSSCVIELGGRKLSADLIELPVLDFDVILGMDWLAINNATIDCFKKCIIFRPEERPEFVFQGDRSEVPTNLISVVKARKLLGKGCQGYLAHVKDTRVAFTELQQILVVRDFPEVFPGEL